MRILLVEDDAVLRDVIRRSLEDTGNRVDSVSTLAAASHLWQVQRFDAVLLDLNLPDGNGLAALHEARARGDRTPVLVLTARNRIDERIAGLDAGADDYLGKPFELGEVGARLRAIVRRARGVEAPTEVGGLRLDRVAGRFFVVTAAATTEIELPAREHAVLIELMTPPGRVVSKRGLSEKLSSFDELLGDNALEAFVSRLRKKLVGSGSTIRTLRGLGYLIEAEKTSA
ncbi:MAG: response regulator transcription factor [Pseudomonadota bacterium]|nr:response regulator transcription factor [Pseudomonadota bacterium]